MERLVDRPAAGRVFETIVPVRFGDAEPDGRLRLDALARILQDAGNDDFLDAGLDPMSPWVARRSTVIGHGWPRIGDELHLSTWCGGLGSRWAERRTSITAAGGGVVEAATLWVFVDEGGRPARMPDWFLSIYGEAAGGRQVSTRLHLGPPLASVDRRPWPLRHTDLDVLGHVNNAAVWAPIEDECARRSFAPAVVELEFAGALLADDAVVLQSALERDRLDIWLSVDEAVRVAARVRTAAR